MSVVLSATEVSRHDRADDLWTVVDGVIYDLTTFASQHPGGAGIILRYAGRDATHAYSQVHAPSLIKGVIASSRQIGLLDRTTIPSSWDEQQASEGEVSSDNVKPSLDSLINTHDFARVAAKTFAPKTWAFVSSAATDLHTFQRNSRAYAKIGLRPRVLRDVSRVDIATSVLGNSTRSPIFCSPASLGRLIHPSGEKALARACQSLGIPQCVSTSASFPLGDIVDAARSATAESSEKLGKPGYSVPFFLQLYVDRDRRKSERLLADAVSHGVRAVFVTVDAPVPGKREADERMTADESVYSPVSGARAGNDSKGGALGRVMGKYIDSSLAWNDLGWLRQCAPGVKIVLKGVQTAMDAVKAMEAGVDGIVVSNHGGRSLDTAPATILVLLELQKCCPQVFDRMEVFIDGGISRGTDIFKALCLGAKAVGIGRGFLYGLNYGEEGVKHYVESGFMLSSSREPMLTMNSSTRRVRDDHEDVWRDQSARCASRLSQHPGR
jgi:L-lactate dehydrogenase (cytochrome)